MGRDTARSRHSRRRSWQINAALGLALAAWAGVQPHAAAPATLFFSEYIEGSSNNKALEIYNGTGAPVDLAAGGYSIQMFFNGATTASTTIDLTGTVADGDVFVLAHASAVPAVLGAADQTSGASWYNGDDAVVLRKGAAILDVIGQIGIDPGTAWGTGSTSTADHTLRRKPAFCADTDGADAFSPAAEWDGFDVDTFDGLGAHVADCGAADVAPSVSSVTPSTDVSWDANLTVTFSEPVSIASGAVALTCTASGAHAVTVTGGPAAFVINPDTDFLSGESCTLSIGGSAVTDLDAVDPPDQMAANFTATFATASVNPCSSTYTPIPAIQGSGATAAIVGAVTTRGVVVGDYEAPTSGSSHMRGFYIQDLEGDGDPATSDAIFVFRPGVDTLAAGDVVRVAGTAGEFQGQTQISNVSSVTSCGTGSVAPVDVTLPWPSAAYPERYEGMLVRLPQTLSVTEHFQLARFGQVVVSSGGVLVQPTDVQRPGPAAAALQAANDLNQIIIDDGTNTENPDPIVFGRSGSPLSALNTLRGGDTTSGAVGVMTFTWAGNSASGNAWRVRPAGALGGVITFAPVNTRPLLSPSVSGSLRVASMNLLNFFNTFQGCRGGVTGEAMDCRGAENQAEFDRQWPKTVAAIAGTNADIVGILEIENDGYGAGSAIQFLVDRLNDATAPGTYAFVDVDGATHVDAMGSDAIKVGLVYKPGSVLPIGTTGALDTVAFVNGGDSAPRNRAALAQAFQQVGRGGQLVVSVNHFKSKGSACDAPEATDGQGNCNAVRRNAARELTSWLASDPTGTGERNVLIVGDLNSYGQEDPIVDIAAAGYVNLLPELGGGASYVFDGQWGSLDHALASASLRPLVVAARDWAINADEPSALDYNTNFKSPGQVASLYAPDQFRISDHNPLLVDLELDGTDESPARVRGHGAVTLTTPAGSARVDIGSPLSFALNVRSKDDRPTGSVSITVRSTRERRTKTFRLEATRIESLVEDGSTRATIEATGVLSDVTRPSAPITIDRRATLHLTVEDNGEPGLGADTAAVSVWRRNGTLWLSTSSDEGHAGDAVLTRGNIQVR